MQSGDLKGRVICYIHRTAIGIVLAEELRCHLYHAKSEDRKEILTAWRQGKGSSVIIATTTLGIGVDYPSVRSVIYVDTPTGMLDYVQETGRAGRDGLHADCLILLAKGWVVTWDREIQARFVNEDRQQMTNYLQSSE